MNLLPLEKVFVRKATDKSKFPRLDVDYVKLYDGLLHHLRTNFYQHIDTSLAQNSAIPGIYTAHNSSHFDEVVRYAGDLLGIKTGEEDVALSSYELYVLLVAIRIHDAGNIHGREDHEKKCFFVLRSFGAVSGDDVTEKKVIALIAQAHGGETSSGDKDTIGELQAEEHMGNTLIRPRLIAAIVRFADEICENKNRSASYLLNNGLIPKHNEAFHRYASAIKSNIVSSKDHRLTLQYQINIEDISQPWGCVVKGENTEIYLIDNILERLEKMDRERRYCNRFSREIYTIDYIRASIRIVNDNLDEIELITVPELCDSGYPDDKKDGHLKEKLNEFCGAGLYQKLSKVEG
jgi:hypothetical protein